MVKEKESYFDVLDCISFLLSKLKFIVISALCGGILLYLYSLTVDDVYKSTAIVGYNTDPYLLEATGYDLKNTSYLEIADELSSREFYRKLQEVSNTNINVSIVPIDRSYRMNIISKGIDRQRTKDSISSFLKYSNMVYIDIQKNKIESLLSSLKFELNKEEIKNDLDISRPLKKRYSQLRYKLSVLNDESFNIIFSISEISTKVESPKRSTLILIGAFFGTAISVLIMLVFYSFNKRRK